MRQLRGHGINFRGPLAFVQVLQLRLCLADVMLRLAHRRRLGFPFQGKQQLPRLHLIAPRHRQIRECAPHRRRNVNIFPLDITLKLPGLRTVTTRHEQSH